MARANWAKATTATGGTGSLTLTSVTGFPTFPQAFGTGTSTVSYIIVSDGLREAGTASFNGTTGVLSSRTVTQAWNGTTYGTSALDFPTSGVEVFCAPIHQEVAYTDPATGYLAAAHMPALTGDVTTSAGAVATTIAADAVTDAKILDGTITLDKMAVSVFPPESHTHTTADLTDFSVSTPASGQFLTWNGTDWVNTTANLSDFGDVDEIAGTDGDFLKFVTDVWTTRSTANVKTDLGIPSDSTKGALSFGFAAPSDATYTLSRAMPYGGTLNTLHYETRSGTVTVTVTIQGANVTGLASLAASSTPNSATATAANTWTAGQRIQITFASGSSPVDFAGTLLFTRS